MLIEWKQWKEKGLFLMFKVHKENFKAKLPRRLINPPKSKMAKVRKEILNTISAGLRTTLGVTV